jgi:hypothetical protein
MTTATFLSYSDFRNSTALWKVHMFRPFVVLIQQHVDDDDDEYGVLVERCWESRYRPEQAQRMD